MCKNLIVHVHVHVHVYDTCTVYNVVDKLAYLAGSSMRQFLPALSLSRLGSLVMEAGKEVSSFFEMSMVVRSGQDGATVSLTISAVVKSL
jgi:hypothetical protein